MAAIVAMAAAGCTKYIPFYRDGGNTENSSRPGGGQGGGGQQGGETVSLKERTDWSINYQGRADFKEDDGSVSRVESFQLNYTGNNLFIIRVFTDEDFKTYYGSDVKALIEGEIKDLNTIAQNDNIEFAKLNNLFDKGVKTLYTDILLHGKYNAFIIEVTSAGKATYNYCRTSIEVVQEAATPAYSSWLGVWNISDKYVGYDIEVTALENNYLYRVDGWETGNAAGSVQMNQDDDWIEARFMNFDGSLSFFIQFLASYENYENLGDVDYMFVGTYVESTGEKVDDYEGWEVAWATKDEDGNVVLNGGNTEFTVNGVTYKPHYNTMRYSLYSYKENGWVHFHDALPTFTEANGWKVPMVRTKGVIEEDRTPVHTKNYLRRTQPKVHVEKKERSSE